MKFMILKVKVTTKVKKIFSMCTSNIEATPKTTINANVVQAMKKLQASYIDDAIKIIKQAA